MGRRAKFPFRVVGVRRGHDWVYNVVSTVTGQSHASGLPWKNAVHWVLYGYYPTDSDMNAQLDAGRLKSRIGWGNEDWNN